MEYNPNGYVIPEFDVFMMATEAHHGKHNLSRTSPGLCRVYSEDDKNYYGQWVEISMFIDVRFPKASTRGLNKWERRLFSVQGLEMIVVSVDSTSLEEASFEPIPNLLIH